MRALREIGVTLAIMLTGAVLGAFAGVTVVTTALFAHELRQGRIVLPVSWIGAFLGAIFGGLCGAVLAPIAAFAPCRHVPLGRLFLVLTSRTIIGGSGAALLLAHPMVALLGGLVGYFTAVEHLRIKGPETGELPGESHSPAGQRALPLTVIMRHHYERLASFARQRVPLRLVKQSPAAELWR